MCEILFNSCKFVCTPYGIYICYSYIASITEIQRAALQTDAQLRFLKHLVTNETATDHR